MKAGIYVSVHLPKTAGSAFRKVLADLCGEDFFLDYDDRPLASGYPARRIRNMQADRERCEKMLAAEMRGDDAAIFVHGHFVATKYESIFPQARHVTWLRDPVERVISQYHYWLREPDPKNDLCAILVENRLSLEAFASLPQIHNVYSRFLGSRDLLQFDFVGITERFAEDLARFYELFGVRSPSTPAPKENANPERGSDRYRVPDAVRRRIADWNAADVALYARARQMREG